MIAGNYLQQSKGNVLRILFAVLLCLAATSATAGDETPAASSIDLLPVFVGACMDPGPDPAKIKEALINRGAAAMPDQTGKESSDPTRLSSFLLTEGKIGIFVVFDQAGSCSVISSNVDIDATRNSLQQFVTSAKNSFEIVTPTDMAPANGENFIASHALLSREGGFKITIRLSKVAKEGHASAVFLTRQMTRS